MTARRPWVLGAVRRPAFALILSLVSAGAMAGFAGYYLRGAWTGYANCHSSGGPGCPAHPFWGLSPELYLAACLLGIGAGALIAVVGGLAYLGMLDRRRAGYALVALSAIGVIAYGGLGVGTAAGVAAGAMILRARSSRAGAPSEWSGSLPTGVPPVLGGPKRPLTDRPPVTEWDGVFATALAGPPGRSRGRVSLPTADRLSAALEKGRTAGLLRASVAPPLPPAVVALPPPPTGLRGSFRTTPVAATPAPPSMQGPGPGMPGGPGLGAGRAPVAGTSPSRSDWAHSPDRWQPIASELSPWISPGSVGSGDAEKAAPPVASLPPSPTGAPEVPPYRLGPLRAPPPRPASPPPRSPRAPVAPPTSVPTSTTPPLSFSTAASPAVTSATFAAPPSPTPAHEPAMPLVPPEPTVTEGSRPPHPTEAIAKARTRAWRCPSCNLVNAPWSLRCTKCKTEPPPMGS